ncbi:DUF3427 domain-containing protein [Ensifer sp. NBAIM29]|nr:DUF3427 domain-containing protein [Ensifer sp. NBAIM29]
MFQGKVGNRYSRDDVQEMLHVPEAKRGGNWDTGYTEWDGQFFVFCNIDVAGRTGHDYNNYWDGPVLVWQAKNGTNIAQPQMQRLINGQMPVHIFHRQQDRMPFTYAGIGYPSQHEDTSPVRMRWAFGQPKGLGGHRTEGDIDRHLFEREYALFEEVVLRHSGHRFQSISSGLPGRWENYKLPLRERALGLLAPETWRREHIGSGNILRAIVRAIEIPGTEGNNFVRWHGQWGSEARQHKGVLDAMRSAPECRRAENVFYSLYKGKDSDGDCFAELVSQFGRLYSLHAYLFFIKNPQAYMPIATATFDKAFARLGVGLKTNQNCSWENYSAYNAALQSTRTLLSSKRGFENCRLVDAHSFLWLLIRVEEEALRARSSSVNRNAVTVKGPREKSIFEMARNAFQAAAQSGKETIHINKNKEVRERELREVIDDLISEQKGLCNITGLRLQFLGDCDDSQMLASLDRIDSNGHYEKQNLQVVCRFVNRWKSDGSDSDFRRLIGIIRSARPEE